MSLDPGLFIDLAVEGSDASIRTDRSRANIRNLLHLPVVRQLNCCVLLAFFAQYLQADITVSRVSRVVPLIVLEKDHGRGPRLGKLQIFRRDRLPFIGSNCRDGEEYGSYESKW